MAAWRSCAVLKPTLAFRTSQWSCKRRRPRRDQVSEGIKAGAYYYLTKPYKGATLLGIVRAALEDARTKTRLKEKVGACARGLGLMEEARFHFQTLEDAAGLASYVSNCFPEPESVVVGLHELLLNAVEHGNLGITYSEKTNLLRNAGWNEEIVRRLGLPEYSKNFATLTFKATEAALTVHIKDAGKEFHWEEIFELLRRSSNGSRMDGELPPRTRYPFTASNILGWEMKSGAP